MALHTQTELSERLGVSKVAVGRLIKRKVIVAGVVFDPQTGKPLGITDLDAAVRDYQKNVDHTDSPQRAAAMLLPVPTSPERVEAPAPADAPDDDLSVATAAARSKHWEAKTRELKYKEAAGELVPSAEVRREWADLLSRVRTKLLAIPTRARQALPALSVADVVKLEDLITEALEDLVTSESAHP